MELKRYTGLFFWDELPKASNFLKKLFFRKTKDKRLVTPSIITQQCKGLFLKDHKIKSILFSTDLALIENNDCDAILAVYPFAPSSRIMETLINFSGKPVICGVGGGKTQGRKSVKMALEAQHLGACAVMVNQPFKNKDIQEMRRQINIPIISSVSTIAFDFDRRIKAGISAFNITGGKQTLEILNFLKQNYPDIPYICTGGKSIEHIRLAISLDARAIVLTPPSNANLFKRIMQGYRETP